MTSLIEGRDEIVRITERIAKDMGISKSQIKTSDKFDDIFILAVREYDARQREIEELRKLI